ncbi:unnamed protein product [Moneuplotes crassus]|uniref:J domain-containing protein n=1 Tax=Euplotes crassus TaxID=5936 RepID=A0AAD1UMA1_EUPCR|nr:unnamed protein product [Moneuplotes crassus]
MEKLNRNHYELLGVTRDADSDVIKKGYRKAALEHHPDKGGTDDAFQAVKEAYDVLSDPIRKRNYDRDLKKYGMKDGLKKTKSSTNAASTKNNFKKQSTTKNYQREETKSYPKEETKSKKPEPTAKPKQVQIPDNLKTLSIKELKALMKQLNLKSDDCFEKKEMIDRVEEYKSRTQGGGSKKATPQAPPRSSASKPTRTASNTSTSAGAMGTDEPIAFKILSVGNQEVGKSCLIKRYCEGRFVKRYISTIGIDYGVKRMNLDGANISINFFDLSGNDDYKLIREEFYEDTQGVLMVYDVDNRDSYVNLVHWESEMRQNSIDLKSLGVVVCANKVDARGREVSTSEGQKWCKLRGYTYFETSANDGKNVSEAFESLFQKVLDKFRTAQNKFGVS